MTTTEIDLGACRTLDDFLDLAREGHGAPERTRGILAAAERHLRQHDFVERTALCRLAEEAVHLLGDKRWAHRLLEEAAQHETTPETLVAIAESYRHLGERGRAVHLLHRAAAASGAIEPCLNLMATLRGQGVEGDDLRHLYITCFEGLHDPAQQLRWVEGILELFGDEDWARRVYAELAGELYERSDQERLRGSFEARFHRPLN